MKNFIIALFITVFASIMFTGCTAKEEVVGNNTGFGSSVITENVLTEDILTEDILYENIIN